MNNPTIDESLTLESVQQRFEAWRINRAKREPIPEPLWKAAAELCSHHPITHVCRRLRLSFAGLKKRLSTPNSVPVQFMEIDTGCFTGPWHLECERPDGSKLRFSGNGQAPAVDHLLLRFLS
jgi:hypothetical protein